MLSSALMAVLITASPARQIEPLRQGAQVNFACSESGMPGLRLIAQTSKDTPLVADGGSSCVTYLTRLDLGR
jgi:hypothetical protein